MKIGIHQHVFTKKLNGDNLDLLNTIRDFGFEAVDVNVRALDIPTARLIGKRARSLDLQILGGGSLPPDRELLSEEKSKRRDAIEYMKGLVRKVHELGSTFYGGIIYAPFSVLTGKAPTGDELNYAAEGLKEVCITAQEYGIDVGLEPANRYETYVINTIGDVLKLIERIDEANAGILFDAYHTTIEEKSLYRAILAAGNRLFHAHASANDRGIPGSGQVHWDDMFRGMKETGYNRVISVEGFVDNKADVASGACIWRKFAASAEEMAVEGIKFLRSMSEKYGMN